jgi:2-oxoglutarate ferredoxin oxidoreductase subunit alpha/2-oxoisovalerate ferredoxin oxidoreductase alpha subunit
LRPLVREGVRLLVVEASDGQIEDELRLALSHAGLAAPISSLRHYGGVLPRADEIVDAALGLTVAEGVLA